MPSTLIDNVYVYSDKDKFNENDVLINYDEEDGILDSKIRLRKKIYNMCLEFLNVLFLSSIFLGIIAITTYVILKIN